MNEKEIINKIKNKEKFTEQEIYELLWDFEQVWQEEGENRRWTRAVSTVIKVGEDFVRIDWEQGLTECQENEFYEQPYLVKSHKYIKTIEVEEWEEI